MQPRLCGAAAALSVFLSACTSLTSRPDARPVAGAALPGVPYALPMLQYDLTITRSLARCTDPLTKGPGLKFTVEVQAAPRYPAGETYTIDYRDLAGPTKTTSLSIEYQENSSVLKSVNALAEDRSGAIAASLAKSAVGLASLVGGIPLPNGAPEQPGVVDAPKGMLVCAAGVAEKLDAVKTQATLLQNQAAKLKAITAAVDALSGRLSALSDADRSTLTQKLAEQTAAAKALVAGQEALDELKAELSFTTRLTWPRRSDETDALLELGDAGLTKLRPLLDWAATDGSANARDNRCDAKDGVNDCLGRKLAGMAVLVPSIASELAEVKVGTRRTDAIQVSGGSVGGLLIRPPVAGRLLVCAASEGSCREDDPKLVFRGDETAIPQLGSLRFLPFRNQAFQHNSLSFSMAPTGQLLKLEYKTLKSQAEEAATALLAGVTEGGRYAAARRAAAAAEEKQASDAIAAERAETLAELQFALDQQKKARELADATAAPSELATVQAQTALTAARVALLQAQQAERDALAALAR